MKALTLFAVLSALAISAQAQTQPPQPPPAATGPLTVLACNWTRAERSYGSSGDQEKKAKDAAIDQQIAIQNRDVSPQNQQAAQEARRLEESKRNQVGLIPLPEGVTKGYLYKVQVRNVSDKTIKRLQWSYVFIDALSQKEMVRHEFYSRIQIHPGQEKKLSAFTRGAPPRVIDAKELSKSDKPWSESVVIESVEFADGTSWTPPAKADQVKPSNISKSGTGVPPVSHAQDARLSMTSKVWLSAKSALSLE